VSQLEERIEALRHQAIAPTQKGFGSIAAGRTVTAAGLEAQRPPALGGEFTTPLLVLHESALRHNVSAMARWCADAGVRLAPHGKTTMAPQLFARQLAAGAWAMTAATISQVQVYRSFGVERILIANELTDPAGIRWLAGALSADPSWECFAYVDSVAGVELLDAGLTTAGAARALPVLVELGFPRGRTGCRSVAEALDVAAAAERAGRLVLAGAAGYEGGLGNDTEPVTLAAVADYCGRLRQLGYAIADRVAPAAMGIARDPAAGGGAVGGTSSAAPIVSAGGSAYFDVVAAELTRPGESGGEAAGGRPAVVLRSGCYLTHDHGEYAQIGPAVRKAGPDLRPAIELWAPVLSCPEPGLALVCAGRRDVSFDQGMPVPLRVRRADGTIEPAGPLRVGRLDDQHAYLAIPDGTRLGPGDLVGFGISHPCTTLDKWRVIPVVDDEYQVIDAVHTFF
jgi:D-serine deaminase-like pyridoxal phosphate-dependent protein